MQNAHAFSLAGQPLLALPSGALWSPADRTLLVGDLHLGKSGRMARRGGSLLPPYETRATLRRLAQDIAAVQAVRVAALGDSFDDVAAWEGIDPADRIALAQLMEGRDWIWVTGNHDPRPVEAGGTWVAAWHLGAIACRHVGGHEGPEISAHYHPKLRLRGVARPCFLIDTARVILPAYGAYTGGMDCLAPPLAGLMGAGAIAVLTGTRALPCPLPRAA